MLDTAMHLLDGTNVVVAGTVTDIGRRINTGDPTCGWVGDPSMVLVIDNEEWITDSEGRTIWPRMRNPYWGWFEVWGVDAHDHAYLATRSKTCDANLLRRLAEGHWSRGNPADRLMAEAERRRASQLEDDRARNAEIADKLQFALRRDIGAYEGGLSRRIY